MAVSRSVLLLLLRSLCEILTLPLHLAFFFLRRKRIRREIRELLEARR
ncbi:MAG: hypothetical protein HY812_00665 [Planctomycetes bacterium]|nr:hypothetical protein [Planctomycetota bacterium]